MKILVFTSIYPIKGTKSGFTPIVKYFCEDWVRLGHQVYVVSSPSKFPLPFYFIPKFFREFVESKVGFNIPNLFSRKRIITNENGVKVFQLPISKFKPGTILDEQVVERNINIIEKEFLGDFKPDLCIGHWINPQVQYISYFKKKYKSISALILHSVPTNRELQLLYEHIDNIDKLGFRSRKLIQGTLDRLTTKNINYFICHSGVKDYFSLATKNYEPKKIDQEKIKLCFIGNLISRKYPTILLESVNKIQDVQFEIHYIGSGYLEKELKKIPFEKNINVTFHGRLTREEVYYILNECNLLVMLSENEAFGLVYLEAMLNKTIPIASYNEGFDGIIQHRVNGFLGNSGDVDDLTQILKDYIKMDLNDLYKIQENAFQTAIEMTDLKMAKTYLNYLIDGNQK